MPISPERLKELMDIDDTKLLVGYKFLYKLPAKRPKAEKLAAKRLVAKKAGTPRASSPASKKPASKK